MNEIFHSVFSVSILPTPSKPIQYESHIHNHALNLPYSAIKAPDITSTIATQTNKSLSHSIHPRIRFAQLSQLFNNSSCIPSAAITPSWTSKMISIILLKRCAITHGWVSPRLQRRQERILFLAVQRTRRLVQKKDRGITQNRSRQRQSLLPTSRHRLSHCS